jgi:hypothetical protein
VFVFIESRLFSRLAQEYLLDDDYAALQAFLVASPEAGNLTPGAAACAR